MPLSAISCPMSLIKLYIFDFNVYALSLASTEMACNTVLTFLLRLDSNFHIELGGTPFAAKVAYKSLFDRASSGATSSTSNTPSPA